MVILIEGCQALSSRSENDKTSNRWLHISIFCHCDFLAETYNNDEDDYHLFAPKWRWFTHVHNLVL